MVYEEDSIVEEELLHHLSQWVLFDQLERLGRHLGLTQTEISQIMIPDKGPKEQIWQVKYSIWLVNQLYFYQR